MKIIFNIAIYMYFYSNEYQTGLIPTKRKRVNDVKTYYERNSANRRTKVWRVISIWRRLDRICRRLTGCTCAITIG